MLGGFRRRSSYSHLRVIRVGFMEGLGWPRTLKAGHDLYMREGEASSIGRKIKQQR